MVKARAMAMLLGMSALGVVITGLTALSFCQSLGRATPAEKPVPEVARAATPDAVPEAFSKNLTGQALSVDRGARQMTVKPSVWVTSKEVTFAVAEPVAPMLAEVQPGDLVRVGYVEAHGQLIARAISKIPAEHETER